MRYPHSLQPQTPRTGASLDDKPIAKSGVGCITEKQSTTKNVRIRAKSPPAPVGDPRKRNPTSRRTRRSCTSSSCDTCPTVPMESGQISVIEEKCKDPISAASEPNRWDEHTFTLDSGACDRVCSNARLGVSTVPGDKSIKGVSYEVANGEEIANLGEKQCVIALEDVKEAIPLTLQVCDVHKSLLSIGKIVKAWKKVVCDSQTDGGAHTECKDMGEKMPLTHDGNLWALKA